MHTRSNQTFSDTSNSFARALHFAADRTLIPRCMIVCLFGVLIVASGCTHMDPYEYVEKARMAPNDVRRMLPPISPKQPDFEEPVYIGHLRRRLTDADDLRSAMQLTLKQLRDERSIYDGAFWATAPYLAYNPAPRNLVRAAAAFGGWYAVLSSRPKEIVPLYEQGVERLSCLIVEYQPYLYSTDEFSKMAQHLSHFHTALGNFKRDTATLTDVVAAFVPKSADSPTCAAPGGAECSARARALGFGTQRKGSSSEALERYFVRQSSAAVSKLDRFEALVFYIKEGAARYFFSQAQFIMQGVGIQLRVNQPVLAQHSFAAPAAPVASTGAGVKGQSDRGEGDKPATRPALPAGISTVANEQSRHAERTLELAELNADHFFTQHARRADLAQKAMQSRGCALTTAAIPPAPATIGTGEPNSTQTWLP